MFNMSIEATIPLIILIGLGASIMASAVGIGGGLVAIPFILMVIGFQNTHQAKLITYVLIVALSLFGVHKYWRQKRLPDWKASFWILIGSVPTSIICLLFVDPLFANVPKWVWPVCYAGVIVLVLIIVNFHHKIVLKKVAPTWTLPIMGAIVGVLAGSFGLSGGILFVPILLVALKKDPKDVAVNSLALKMITSLGEIITGLASNNGYRQFEHPSAEAIANGQHAVYWYIPLIIIIGAAIGSQIGPVLNKRMNQKQIILTYNIALGAIFAWEIASAVLIAKGII